MEGTLMWLFTFRNYLNYHTRCNKKLHATTTQLPRSTSRSPFPFSPTLYFRLTYSTTSVSWLYPFPLQVLEWARVIFHRVSFDAFDAMKRLFFLNFLGISSSFFFWVLGYIHVFIWVFGGILDSFIISCISIIQTKIIFIQKNIY